MKNNNSQFLAKIQFLNMTKLLNIVKFLFYYLDRFLLLFIKKPKKVGKKKKVLIIANLGLGDAINFLSVIDKYRTFYPKNEYSITLMVPSGFSSLFKEESDFDSIISVNFNKSVTNLLARYKLIKLINHEYYDTLIDIMGATGAAINVYLSAASYAGEKITIRNVCYSICPSFLVKKAYTKVFEINEPEISNVEYYNYLFDFIANQKTPIILHKTKDYQISVEIPKKYYIVFPGASSSFRKWDLDRYVKLIQKIYKKTSLPVLFCGTNIDLESVNYLMERLEEKQYKNILGTTNMLEFIQIIKNASFVITNDTGSYHVAVNEEVPVTLITGCYALNMYALYQFLDSNYKKPYVVSLEKGCKNCFYQCPYIQKGSKVWPCLDEITVDKVWKVVEKMIDETGDKYEKKK